MNLREKKVLTNQELNQLVSEVGPLRIVTIAATETRPKITRLIDKEGFCTSHYMVQDLFEWKYRAKVSELPDGSYNIIEYATSQGKKPTQRVISLVDGEYVVTKEDLPTLSAKGYTFKGWYIGETQVTEGYVLTKNTVLTAAWEFTPGGGGGDYSKWEVGDIVLHDEVEDKKVKSTKDDYNLEAYPIDRYTPIGIVSEVHDDLSAVMLSLVNMDANTPETGSIEGTSLCYGGNNFNVPELADYGKVGNISEINGLIDSISEGGQFPSTRDDFFGLPSADELRFYPGGSGSISGGTSGGYIPSPYLADGSFNTDFFRESFRVGPFYCWSRYREEDQQTYYMYTDTQEVTQDTILWCGTRGNNSQVKNYGSTTKIDGYSIKATMLGNIMDESVFDGGVEAFVSEFTALPDDTYEENYLLANSDLNGKLNCGELLKYQRDFSFDRSLYGDDVLPWGQPAYCWMRYNENNGRIYILYTTVDENNLSTDTSIYIPGYESSFIYDYGTLNSGSYDLRNQSSNIGTIGDENYISGGVEGFLDHFTRIPNGIPLYYWERYNESDGKTYFLYTTDESNDLTADTGIYIPGQSYSFVYDYGTVNIDNSSTIRYIGTIGDESYISGGVEGFLEHFTRKSTSSWRTTSPIQNEAEEGNYPVLVSTYRFSTIGTEKGDWYCPACSELSVSLSNSHQIQDSLKRVKLIASLPVSSILESFISSTEANSDGCWAVNASGTIELTSKSSTKKVRAMYQLSAL